MLRQYLLAYVGRKVDLSLIAGYARHILSLPMNFFEMRQVGEILSRVNDAAKVREAISGATLRPSSMASWSCSPPPCCGCTTCSLALVATLFAPLLVDRRARSTTRPRAAARAKPWKTPPSSPRTWSKTFPAWKRSRPTAPSGARCEEGEHRLVRLVQSIFSLQKLSISMTAVGGLISGLAGIVILWYGGHRVIAGALTIGELMFFYTLLGYMLEPLERLATRQPADSRRAGGGRSAVPGDGPRDRTDRRPQGGVRRHPRAASSCAT